MTRPRFRLRTLMLLVLIISAGLGMFIRRATVQRDAVRAIMAAGGTVTYDFQRSAGFGNSHTTPPGPKWLVRFLGVDFFANVISVNFTTPQSDAVFAHVGRLRRLRTINARPVRVTDAGLAHLSELSDLRALSCTGTPELTDAGLAHLAGLTQIKTLTIEGQTRIVGPGLAHLAGLQQLTCLFVSTETDDGLPSLSRLSSLRKLYISMARISDSTFPQLARLTLLQELGLGGETGSDAGMAHLQALTHLEMFQLDGASFTDAGMEAVAGMKQLSTFFVSDQTSVTGPGLKALQQQRPSLRIGVNGTGRASRAQLDQLRRAIQPGSTSTPPQPAKS